MIPPYLKKAPRCNETNLNTFICIIHKLQMKNVKAIVMDLIIVAYKQTQKNPSNSE